MSDYASLKVSEYTRDEYKEWCSENNETYDSGLQALLSSYDPNPSGDNETDPTDTEPLSNTYMQDGLDHTDLRILDSVSSTMSKKPNHIASELTGVDRPEAKGRMQQLLKEGYLKYTFANRPNNNKDIYCVTSKGLAEIEDFNDESNPFSMTD